MQTSHVIEPDYAVRKSVRMQTFVLLIVSTLTIMAGATLAPSLPSIQRAFADREDVELWVKLVMTIPGLSIALGAPLWGLALDRSRKKPLLAAAMLVYGVAGASGFVFAHSLGAILVGRALLGLAVAGVMTASNTLAAAYFEGPRLSRYMGLAAACGGFASVLFLALGGVLAELGFRYVFLIYLTALVLLPVAMAALSEPDANVSIHETESASHPPEMHIQTASLHGATAQSARALGSFFTLALFEIFTLYMVPMYYPFFVEDVADVSSTVTGLAIAAMMLTTACVSLGYRRLAERFSFVPLHAIGLLSVGLGFIVLGAAHDLVVSLVGLGIAGVGFGVLRPNLMVWLITRTPLHRRGRAIGVVTTAFFAGQFISPFVGGPMVARVGLGSAFQLLGAVALLCASGFGLRVWLDRSRTMGSQQTAQP